MPDYACATTQVGRRIGFYPRECSASDASPALGLGPSSSLGLANPANLSGHAQLGADPCGEAAAPGRLFRPLDAVSRALRERPPLVDKLVLVVLGVLLSFCCLEAWRRVQEWRERLASGAKATRRHWRSLRYSGLGAAEGAEGRGGLEMEMEMEMEMRDVTERGNGAAPRAPSVRSCSLPFARPTKEALPGEGAAPVSDEDETSSEHCLIAR